MHVLELPRIGLPECCPVGLGGSDVLGALFELAEAGVAHLRDAGCRAAISRVRGTGKGVSLTEWVEALEQTLPVNLETPFEGSPNVAGGVWDGREHLGMGCERGMLKLQFAKGCDDLPLHAHEHSDRFIIAIGGRGFFHVSGEFLGSFSGSGVRTVPVRSRDVLMFQRGVVHTFSSPSEPLVLLSYHSPFIPLDDRDQYTVPEVRVTPADLPAERSCVSCDPAWNVIV